MRGLFLSSVAHELRTPLNSIIPILRMMLETMKGEISERAYNYLKVILNSALHLESVIEDALDVSRLENNKFSIFKQMFNLKSAIEEVCDIMRFELQQKGLGLKIKISDNVPSKILSDLKRFKQVLFNLLGNASKFTFEGYLAVKVSFEDEWLETEV